MPFKRVKPKKFMYYRGVGVYHCYRDDDASQPYDYHFTTDVSERDQSCEFDVRELPQPPNTDPFPEPWIRSMKALTIQHAIENGLLKRPT